MKITAVEVYRADLPLTFSMQHFAAGRVDVLEEVYVRVQTDTGLSGVGEARGNAHYLTGDTPERVTTEILRHLAPRILGRDPRELTALLDDVERAVAGAHGSAAAVDIALHDLVARAYGVPLFVLLGGAVRDSLPSNQSIWYGPPDVAARLAAEYVAQGFRHLKVRAGLRPFEQDLERVRAVREAAGGGVSLAIDANMAWSAREAVSLVRRLERFDLAYVEQPVPHRDFTGLRYVTRHTDVPIMADESIQSLDDVATLAREHVVDALHLKLIKLGGIRGLRRAAAVAEAAGLDLMVGQMNEGALATTAAAHCAIAIAARHLELYGAEGIAWDPASGFALRQGSASFPEGPGLGTTLDLAKLRHVETVALTPGRTTC